VRLGSLGAQRRRGSLNGSHAQVHVVLRQEEFGDLPGGEPTGLPERDDLLSLCLATFEGLPGWPACSTNGSLRRPLLKRCRRIWM